MKPVVGGEEIGRGFFFGSEADGPNRMKCQMLHVHLMHTFVHDTTIHVPKISLDLYIKSIFSVQLRAYS